MNEWMNEWKRAMHMLIVAALLNFLFKWSNVLYSFIFRLAQFWTNSLYCTCKIYVTITLRHIVSAPCKWALPFHRNMLYFILHIYRVSCAVDVTVLFCEQQNPHIDLNEVWTQNSFNESLASYLKPEVPLPLIIKCWGSKCCHLQTIRKVNYLH